MEYIIDILKISIPALLVFWASYSTITRFFEREKEKQSSRKEGKKDTMALRLKAYERLTLFLERIVPDNLIQRTQSPTMSCAELQINLLKTIRMEYEHNLTQQLYVSDEAWESVKIAKETINQLINTAMARVSPEAPSLELAKVLIETYHNSETTPTEMAVRQLKAEVVNMMS